MTKLQYLYNTNYSEDEKTLSSIEQRSLFGQEFESKVFFSNTKICPSHSPFIKNRLELLLSDTNYSNLLHKIELLDQIKDNYNVKYIKLTNGDSFAAKRNSLCKEIIQLLPGTPNYCKPDFLYGLTYFQGKWHFGVLSQNSNEWKKHNKRPYTYSNSLKINMAKVLVNLAGQGDLTRTIIDPCCGAGTVLLEGCFAGYKINGSDISWKTSRNAKVNLEHFNYNSQVNKMSIQLIEKHYDSSIIDLPYGLYSKITPDEEKSIIQNAIRISDRTIIVSAKDILNILSSVSTKIVDTCVYIKSVNREFTRFIYVCDNRYS